MTTTTTHRNKFCPEKTTRHLFSSLHSVNVTSLLLSLLSWSISSGTFDLAPRKRVFPSKFRPFFFFFSPLRTTKSVQRVFPSSPPCSSFEIEIRNVAYDSYIRSYCRNSSFRHSSIRFSVSPFDRCEHGTRRRMAGEERRKKESATVR